MALRGLEAAGGVVATLRDEAGAELGRPVDPRARHLLIAILVDHYGAHALRNDRAVAALAQAASTDPGR
ncbi:hypothetical protein [Rubrivirga marina]|nr:hypothetical protein [Rubrivirga marina]